MCDVLTAMSNVCPGHLGRFNLRGPRWNGWSPDLTNSRFQNRDSGGLDERDVARLELKWAFALPAAAGVYAQPTIVDGTVFVGSDAGYLYAVDAATGCVYWSFRAEGGIRSAVTVASPSSTRSADAVYFGDVRGNVYALSASTGTLMWRVRAHEHRLARIIGAVKVHEGRVYVPVASLEEPEASVASYQCCTFRGMVLALDAVTGRTLWRRYTIEEASRARTTPEGVAFLGPSGAGVWSSPALDLERRVLYFGTGNGFSEPATRGTNAVFALDMNTGKVRWAWQAAADIWRPGCVSPEVAARTGKSSYVPYCPRPLGPDVDFAAGVIIAKLPNGRTLLIASQKSGDVWALDPDHKGALVWRRNLRAPPVGANGEILFGAAADDSTLYVPVKSGHLVALDLATGEVKWSREVLPQESQRTHKGITAAATVIPGAVLTGGLDGMVRAFAARDGTELWSYDTTQAQRTVNGVAGKGGSIGSAGPTVAGGMLFINSGYVGFQNGNPGNLLLAFAPSVSGESSASGR